MVHKTCAKEDAISLDWHRNWHNLTYKFKNHNSIKEFVLVILYLLYILYRNDYGCI